MPCYQSPKKVSITQTEKPQLHPQKTEDGIKKWLKHPVARASTGATLGKL